MANVSRYQFINLNAMTNYFLLKRYTGPEYMLYQLMNTINPDSNNYIINRNFKNKINYWSMLPILIKYLSDQPNISSNINPQITQNLDNHPITLKYGKDKIAKELNKWLAIFLNSKPDYLKNDPNEDSIKIHNEIYKFQNSFDKSLSSLHDNISILEKKIDPFFIYTKGITYITSNLSAIQDMSSLEKSPSQEIKDLITLDIDNPALVRRNSSDGNINHSKYSNKFSRNF